MGDGVGSAAGAVAVRCWLTGVSDPVGVRVGRGVLDGRSGGVATSRAGVRVGGGVPDGRNAGVAESRVGVAESRVGVAV